MRSFCGLVREHLYLVEGTPGSGKTTLALQFLLEGLRLGERRLYITLSETGRELTAAARSHGWSLASPSSTLFRWKPTRTGSRVSFIHLKWNLITLSA
jgi:circadian clock protein KaiC